MAFRAAASPGPASCRTLLTLGVLLLGAAFSGPLDAAAGGLAGRWVLNEALTQEAQPEGSKRSAARNAPRAGVTVGGMPVPGTGGSAGVAGSAPDPRVVRSDEFSLADHGETLHLVFTGHGEETLRRGNDQGQVSRWNQRKLTVRYRTTTRTVRQVFELRPDDRLLVTVTLNPKQGSRVTHVRIFDRG